MISDSYPDATVDVFATEPFNFAIEHDAAMVAELAPDLEVRFVRLPALISMKEAAGRARDVDDVEHLRQILQELQRNA